jgi:hypothetical protein
MIELECKHTYAMIVTTRCSDIPFTVMPDAFAKNLG